MLKTVNDMYTNAQQRTLALLSNYDADFWQEYVLNHDRYDRLFRQYYFSYKYFLQLPQESIEDVTNHFIDDVYNHLLIHSKRYSELYRANVIDDDDYSIIDNYRIEEKMDRDNTNNSTNTYGERNDLASSTIGQQINSNENSVAPFNSNEYQDNNKTDSTIGSRTDSGSFTKGSQTDSLGIIFTEDYTLTKHGNIGVQTGTDMLKKHTDYWKTYEFYSLIFREVSRELLSV